MHFLCITSSGPSKLFSFGGRLGVTGTVERRKLPSGVWGTTQPQTIFEHFICYSMRFNSCFSASWTLTGNVFKTENKRKRNWVSTPDVALHAIISNWRTERNRTRENFLRRENFFKNIWDEDRVRLNASSRYRQLQVSRGTEDSWKYPISFFKLL